MLQINIYIEDDQLGPQTHNENSNHQLNLIETDTKNTLSTNKPSPRAPLSENNSLNNSTDLNEMPQTKIRNNISSNSSSNMNKLKVSLIEDEGYFLIDKQSKNSQTFILTITIAFARNLIRVSLKK
jgi:hypothetical protein